MMDLRRKLLLYLGSVLLALLVVACALVAASLREDVADEMAASSRLARVMLSLATEGPAALASAGDAPLRHLSVTQERSDMERPLQNGSTDLVDWLAAWLQREGLAEPVVQRVEMGDEVFLIRADPRSEVAEIVQDASRLLLALVAFGAVALVSVWMAVGRALSPVRELERRLAAIDQGSPSAAPAQFELPEFVRISQAIDQLATRLAAARERESALTRRLIRVQEEERRDIARELHDELGQSLAAMAVTAAYIERNAGRADPKALADSAAEIRRESGRVQDHVRQLLARLRPHGLEQVGLLAAVRDYTHGWAARAAGMNVRIALPDALPSLPAQAALALYRVVQEALTNVLRHSRATRVEIALEVGATRLVLRIADDGVGRAETLERHAGCGIRGMRERAAMVGGQLRFEDGDPSGVMIAWELLLEQGTGGESA
ncbi:sensor histidine kinase [Denitromonas iodatirespirans]|uniref:histidine kinase n=1 Tax=Denitromonas iodatirespirans TaxID=2795389 RepID=A0A944DAP2_DENI1|nr:sensor histidine kinase [Denitromonas iodatirespirans]MBT0961536.1 sensor histidine kinase [Denitromonas iodatirespirans]